MSFCSDIKTQLSEIKISEKQKLSLAYGMLLFGKNFSYSSIGLQTASRQSAELYYSLLNECFGIAGVKSEGGNARKNFRISVPSDTDRLKILASLDYGMHSEIINNSIIHKSGGDAVFIRGAFLSCGNINAPNSGYRAEFAVKSKPLADELEKMLIKNGISVRISKRGNGFTVYTGSSDGVINLLTLLGATERSLNLIEITILKSVKNNMNRARNCDNANISKTVEASITQRRAIAYLEKTGKLQTLEPPLYMAAVIRRDNPELSLKQLCKLSPEPITPSGLNHRLQKIIELYHEAIESRRNK